MVGLDETALGSEALLPAKVTSEVLPTIGTDRRETLKLSVSVLYR